MRYIRNNKHKHSFSVARDSQNVYIVKCLSGVHVINVFRGDKHTGIKLINSLTLGFCFLKCHLFSNLTISSITRQRHSVCSYNNSV